eukprot:TRINITY_DN39304_c0_g1_i1.p4 TRINITY_DN39304_c0_g1~~TRINITY_DN39304_c0_g1_i1.p4  ORF type:complete len:107 (+),score=0.58 TRINITY_DN39304_c0_g1_i1:649-969(+)
MYQSVAQPVLQQSLDRHTLIQSESPQIDSPVTQQSRPKFAPFGAVVIIAQLVEGPVLIFKFALVGAVATGQAQTPIQSQAYNLSTIYRPQSERMILSIGQAMRTIL